MPRILVLSNDLDPVVTIEVDGPGWIVSAARTADGMLEVVMEEPASLRRYSIRDGYVSEASLSADGKRMVDARYLADRWLLAWQVEETGEIEVREHAGPLVATLEKLGSLGALHGGFLYTEISAPFTIRRFDASGNQLGPMHVGQGLLDSLRALGDQESLDAWASLSAVALDRAFVQTLADLGSDRRAFVVFGEDGQVLSSRIVTAPVGLAGRIPGRREILGSRLVPSAEIVRYRWKWVSVEDSVSNAR